jgi:hypothetical protein
VNSECRKKHTEFTREAKHAGGQPKAGAFQRSGKIGYNPRGPKKIQSRCIQALSLASLAPYCGMAPFPFLHEIDM